MTKKSSRKNKKRPSKNSGLKVKYAEADRVRSLLLSQDVQVLSKRDIQTLLNILDDVYPVRERKSHQIWKPLLIGVGIGLILVIGVAIMS